MSKQSERDTFIGAVVNAGLTVKTARLLLRHAATLQRLAEAQCNGDWPADNGERKVIACPRCESFWIRSSMVKDLCKDCRTQEHVLKALDGSALIPDFQGDPRGYVLRLYPADSVREDRESGRIRGIGVPA